MKIDKYTKVILTIIAFCLVWICFKGIAYPLQASAQKPPSEVVITGIKIPKQSNLGHFLYSVPVCDTTEKPQNQWMCM